MEYQRFDLGGAAANCYLLWSGKEAGIIDPGGPAQELVEFVLRRELNLHWIINTHGHADHIFGNKMLRDQFKIPVFIHENDRPMLASPLLNFSRFFGIEFSSPDAEKTISDGEIIELGTEKITVIATPGHTQGGISLYTPGIVFTGDTLFREGIGRTDLPGGNYKQLLDMIYSRLLTLPPETLVLPGHGDSTTIGHEAKYNPFIGIR
ncbi:MAG: MBL fold metallo-hydrolase [Firmicutes bacterium]|nr:MBL fold metallo-hydrolase [Bacillota bacterium]